MNNDQNDSARNKKKELIDSPRKLILKHSSTEEINLQEIEKLEIELGIKKKESVSPSSRSRVFLNKLSRKIKNPTTTNAANAYKKSSTILANNDVSDIVSNFNHVSEKACQYPHQDKIKKIVRKLDNQYVKQIKQTDRKFSSSEIMEEMNKYNKMISDIKKVSRDEDLLRMQKDNQEIENQLKLLKNKDKSELKMKEEESRNLIEELNRLFNDKKKKALEKDEERKKIIEEIKQIKKDQEDHKNTITKFTEEKERLTKILKKLEKDVDKLKTYKEFIDKVLMSSNESSNNEFEKLREKFENLISRMQEIQNEIDEQESQINGIKKEQNELIRKNDKQSQNKKLVDLESEIKRYIEMNKKLEKEIEDIQRKNQKKDSDTHQIKLSITNLYIKSKYKETNDKKKNILKNGIENLTDGELCNNLTDINERIVDLIKIYKEFK